MEQRQQAIRGLSLTQPWATLVAYGAKHYETRSWQTRFRGQIAIHAAQDFPQWAADLCRIEPFRSALTLAGFVTAREMPRGAIIGICQITDIQPITPANIPDEPERAFGDYRIGGRYRWRLENVRALTTPIAAKGALGLWMLDDDLVIRVVAALVEHGASDAA